MIRHCNILHCIYLSSIYWGESVGREEIILRDRKDEEKEDVALGPYRQNITVKTAWKTQGQSRKV